MMIVAGCAVVFNIILGLVLHGFCKIPHSHSHGGHGHSHIHNLENGHEHLTSNSKLHSDSDSDSDDFEGPPTSEKQVRESLIFLATILLLFCRNFFLLCYYCTFILWFT